MTTSCLAQIPGHSVSIHAGGLFLKHLQISLKAFSVCRELGPCAGQDRNGSVSSPGSSSSQLMNGWWELAGIPSLASSLLGPDTSKDCSPQFPQGPTGNEPWVPQQQLLTVYSDWFSSLSAPFPMLFGQINRSDTVSGSASGGSRAKYTTA